MARLAILAGAVLLTACSGDAAPPPVVRVDRGTVATTVTASGSLVAITEQNLGFAEGGRLAEVLVSVGDRVQTGDVLARLEDFALEQALERARAQLDQARANLAKIENGNSVEAAQASLDQAREILGATQDQVDATNAANDVATERARVQLDFDRDQLDRAQDRLAADEAGCSSPPPTTTSSSGLLAGTEQTAPTPAPDPECEAIAADETAVQQARGAVIASETALRTAEQREHVDEAEALRAALPPDVYVWVNAYKRAPAYYDDTTLARLMAVDPLFGWNNVRHQSRGHACRAGHSVLSVDGDGNARRCHFTDAPRGNLYDGSLRLDDAPAPCPNATCGCHIGYVHLERLRLDRVFGDGLLERIPNAPLSRSDAARASGASDRRG